MGDKNRTVQDMKKAHRVLASFEFEPGGVNRGYTDRVLYINLSENRIESKSIPKEVKNRFTGGRGYGLWYLWNAVSGNTKWSDPENEIIITTGPICGITQYPGCGKSHVVSLSPNTGTVIDANVGGYFGPFLKFSGWDVLEIQGKAERDVIISIDGNKGIVTIEEAPEEAIDSHILGEQLTEMFADSERDKKNVSIVSSGRGAQNSMIGMLNFSFYDPRRKTTRFKQAGRGGIGTVFRDKKIKALVIKYTGIKGDLNKPADIDRIKEAGRRINKEIRELDHLQNRMREVGTTYIPERASALNIMPTYNFKYGSHPDIHKITADKWETRFTKGLFDGCWYGCSLSCCHTVDGFELKTGPHKGQKVTVDGPEYESIAALGSNCGIFDPDHIIECSFYCDTYGIDTISFGAITAFIMECYKNGIINKDITGGLELKFGNGEAAMELLHQLGRGAGFGKIAGLGIRRMKKIFVEKHGDDAKFLQDIGMECKGLEYSEYVTKELTYLQAGYGLANKGPQHDETCLEIMDGEVPFEEKVEALYYFPLWRTWFSLNGLCKLPWNDIKPADNDKTDEPAWIPEHVRNYIDLYFGVTGKEVSREDLIHQSEVVHNFQRLFNLKMGYGTKEHDAVPYRSMGPVTKEEYKSRAEHYDKQLEEIVGFDPEGKSTEDKMKALRAYKESQYQKLGDAVYRRRGWDCNGVPTLETVKRLKIDFPDVLKLLREYQGGEK